MILGRWHDAIDTTSVTLRRLYNKHTVARNAMIVCMCAASYATPMQETYRQTMQVIKNTVSQSFQFI